ncbi:hypothetical protein HZU83_11895 [Sphaerotilus montanus]|uniref:Uncharacterized protein n=1 Tax=Sphaerotilus montanus TaxID=522889 RepID=A0A7Y9QZM9_9BURK|nr:hypothetical protein [Sphaerotilus montanus]NYG33574.1 hypothetical protein [Sphaerotilus montanus]NZD57391.1 hypothetical protein [Sphaerotilus montanus]
MNHKPRRSTSANHPPLVATRLLDQLRHPREITIVSIQAWVPAFAGMTK